MTTPNSSYIASVAKHSTVGRVDYTQNAKEIFDNAMDVVAQNLVLYDTTAKAAKEDGAQLIVFPEWGLFGTCKSTVLCRGKSPASSRNAILPFAQRVPDSKKEDLTVLDDSKSIVRELAKVAKKYRIVVVANICEKTLDKKEKTLIYNTEISIDEDGKLLAKYHKLHPYFTQTFDTPTNEDKKEVKTFQTSFGVKFGLFICYDIFHTEPQKSLHLEKDVSHFPYSFAFPNLPIVRWYCNRWAKKNNSILLASSLGGGGTIAGPVGSVTNLIKKDTHLIATIKKL